MMEYLAQFSDLLSEDWIQQLLRDAIQTLVDTYDHGTVVSLLRQILGVTTDVIEHLLAGL